MTVYEIVTNKIIEKLESGCIPWQKPWVNGAVNWQTQKAYRGVNTMLLDDGEYATFKAIQANKGTVKKGEKSHMCVFWNWLQKEDENGKIDKVPMLRYYNVFEINTQVEGLDSKRKHVEFENTPIQECELIVEKYPTKPQMQFAGGSAWYRPADDLVNVPELNNFVNPESFYSTLFHEMVHSTGHESRLKRDGITNTNKFGSQDYSREELVAEMGSAMLCGVARIENKTIDNSASYIQSWLRVLKDDRTMVVKAGSQAQKAVDFILGTKFDKDME